MPVGFPAKTNYAAGDVLTASNVNDITGTLNLLGQITTNAQTGTTYTLVLTDAYKLVELSNAAAITVTVPTNATAAFPVGTQINLLQTGAGQVTIAAAGGVTINSTPGLKLRAPWSAATLIKRATDTWVVIGDTAA